MKKTKEMKDKIMAERCGIITCIHCVGGKCNLDKCDFYERVYCQEH